MLAQHLTHMIFLVQNSFPLREWHIEHMEKTIIKFVTGLSANANSWEKRQHKRYGGLNSICRQIGYDIKHGATTEQVLMLLQKLEMIRPLLVFKEIMTLCKDYMN